MALRKVEMEKNRMMSYWVNDSDATYPMMDTSLMPVWSYRGHIDVLVTNLVWKLVHRITEHSCPIEQLIEVMCMLKTHNATNQMGNIK